MESEFFESWGRDADAKSRRHPEEIRKYKDRYWNKKRHEYRCRGFDPKETSPANRHCIINGEHFSFDLPSGCPYLKQESKYIQFTE